MPLIDLPDDIIAKARDLAERMSCPIDELFRWALKDEEDVVCMLEDSDFAKLEKLGLT